MYELFTTKIKTTTKRKISTYIHSVGRKTGRNPNIYELVDEAIVNEIERRKNAGISADTGRVKSAKKSNK